MREEKVSVPWRKELLLTVLMLVLVVFFGYWQFTDHLRLRTEQEKITRFLKRDITTALAGILNSQPRFGAIVIREAVKGKIEHLLESDTSNSLKAVALFNENGELLMVVQDGALPADWYKETDSAADGVVVTATYKEMASMAGLTSSRPILGTSQAVRTMIEQVSSFSVDANSGNGQERPFGEYVRSLISDGEFKGKEVAKVCYLMNDSFLRQTIVRDLAYRIGSTVFCIIAFVVFTISMFSLARNVKLRILLAREQETSNHLHEMHLLAAGLAHEIKNPLNLVRGMTQSISEACVELPEIRKKTSVVAEEVDRINSRLNSFLAYSNTKPLELVPVSYQIVISEVVELLSVDADDKEVVIKTDLGHDKVLMDEESFRQICFNLIHNAIKAVGEKGRITVSSGKMDKHRVWLKITDDGKGVPEDAVADIFKPYFTLDPAGTGLGLAVVKQLVFKHGWSISYSDAAGGGAEFKIEGIQVA